jgi:tripartite-type tricarboxylate transporter receptor subunit TctC
MEKIMKKIILSFLLAATSYVNAQTCTIVLTLKPGGATDNIARILQKHNPDILVDYKPGAYAIPAMNYADKNPSVVILSQPSMYSKQSPNQTPNVDVIKVFGAYDHGIVTSKNITFADLLTKKINIGISFIGSPAHVIGEQLKSKNPKIELIAFGGDTAAFTSVKNGDVDAYITAWPSIHNWTIDHGFKNLARVNSITGVVQEGVSLSNISRVGLFMSKNATKEQKEQSLKCLNVAINSEGAKRELKENHLTLLNQEGNEAIKSIQTYIDVLKYYGI